MSSFSRSVVLGDERHDVVPQLTVGAKGSIEWFKFCNILDGICHRTGCCPRCQCHSARPWRHEAPCSPLQSPLVLGMISPIGTFQNQLLVVPNHSCCSDTMLRLPQRRECFRSPPFGQMRWPWLQDSWVDERWMQGPCEVVLGVSIVLLGSPCIACPMAQKGWETLVFVLLGVLQVVDLLWWCRSHSWIR